MGKTTTPRRPIRVIKPKSKKHTGKPPFLTPEQRARLDAFNRYVTRTMNDDSGEQEATWSVLKKALDENRTSARRHFSE